MQKTIDPQKMVEAIHNNPVAPGATAVGAIGVGVITYMDILSNIAGTAAAFAGATLAVLLCIKEWLKIKRMNSVGEEAICRHAEGKPCNRKGEQEAIGKVSP